MEIRELVEKMFKLKILRNHFEVIAAEIELEHEHDKDNKDRMGLPFSVESNSLNDAVYSLGHGLNYINEAIARLEAAHRRSIRFKEVKQSEDKKTEPDQNKGD